MKTYLIPAFFAVEAPDSATAEDIAGDLQAAINRHAVPTAILYLDEEQPNVEADGRLGDEFHTYPWSAA